MSYAKLRFRQNCVHGYISLSCTMGMVYDDKGFLEGWVALSITQCSHLIANCQCLTGVQRAWVSVWAVKVIRASYSPSVYFLLS